MNGDDIDPEALRLLLALLDVGLIDIESIGDGLTRDDILELLTTPAAREAYQDDRFETLLEQQPAFRLEGHDDGKVDVVLTLGNRCIHTFEPVRPIDDELVAVLGDGLRNLVREYGGTDSGPVDALVSNFRELTGPGDDGVMERARRAFDKLRRRTSAMKALKEWIGTGKSRDDLLESALPDLPEHAQAVLAGKLSEQRAFRMAIDSDHNVHLVLIASGERVHTWTPDDLGVPRPMSWRKIAYSVVGLYIVLTLTSWDSFASWLGQLLPVAVFGAVDGFFLLRRRMDSTWAWRAYWATVALLVLLALVSKYGGPAVLAAFMAVGRIGYIQIWYRLVGGRNILECPNCGALTTHRAWAEMDYTCAGCGTKEEPFFTGRRANWLGQLR